MRSPTLLPTWLRATLAGLMLPLLGATAAAQPLTGSFAGSVQGPATTLAPSGSFAALGGHGAHLGLGYARGGLGVRYGTARAHVRGRYETRCEQVWVPGRPERVWVEPLFQWRHDPCGRRYRVLVRAGHHVQRYVPGRYETRSVRVWVPARRIDRVTHVGRRFCR